MEAVHRVRPRFLFTSAGSVLSERCGRGWFKKDLWSAVTSPNGENQKEYGTRNAGPGSHPNLRNLSPCRLLRSVHRSLGPMAVPDATSVEDPMKEPERAVSALLPQTLTSALQCNLSAGRNPADARNPAALLIFHFVSTVPHPEPHGYSFELGNNGKLGSGLETRFWFWFFNKFCLYERGVHSLNELPPGMQSSPPPRGVAGGWNQGSTGASPTLECQLSS